MKPQQRVLKEEYRANSSKQPKLER
ncbi:Protein of unknown function [Bacillus cytotoxicus]|uniref:Uncharacterized protein n=1 Tax=Bacillus cytotoxicus TaxID=580165 RepID=A0AAX2CBH8_9BACI|nr:Protein of unknown function [Bacillus cytotoxicus]SCN29532.1 Protein of unknown function [Bacillus cytotoxicus]